MWASTHRSRQPASGVAVADVVEAPLGQVADVERVGLLSVTEAVVDDIVNIVGSEARLPYRPGKGSSRGRP